MNKLGEIKNTKIENLLSLYNSFSTEEKDSEEIIKEIFIRFVKEDKSYIEEFYKNLNRKYDQKLFLKIFEKIAEINPEPLSEMYFYLTYPLKTDKNIISLILENSNESKTLEVYQVLSTQFKEDKEIVLKVLNKVNKKNFTYKNKKNNFYENDLIKTFDFFEFYNSLPNKLKSDKDILIKLKENITEENALNIVTDYFDVLKNDKDIILYSFNKLKKYNLGFFYIKLPKELQNDSEIFKIIEDKMNEQDILELFFFL